MKCSRITDRGLMRVLLDRELPAYLDEHPDCPLPLAVYEILNKKQAQKTRHIAEDINILPGVKSKYTSNIVGKWRRAERPVPREVESFMRAEIIRCILGDTGDLLADLLGEGVEVMQS